MARPRIRPEEELALGGALIAVPAPVTDVTGAALIADALGKETKAERKNSFKWILLGGALGFAASLVIFDAILNSPKKS